MAATNLVPHGSQVYVYTLNSTTNLYNLTQTLQGNTSDVTGFGADIGKLRASHALAGASH